MSIPVSPVGSALSQAMPHGMHITLEWADRSVPCSSGRPRCRSGRRSSVPCRGPPAEKCSSRTPPFRLSRRIAGDPVHVLLGDPFSVAPSRSGFVKALPKPAALAAVVGIDFAADGRIGRLVRVVEDERLLALSEPRFGRREQSWVRRHRKRPHGDGCPRVVHRMSDALAGEGLTHFGRFSFVKHDS